MKLLIQILIVLSVCWIGEWISYILPFAFPASVISMILLFILLFVKMIKIDHIKEKTNFLLQNMGLFFIPAGVSIIQYLDLLQEYLIQLILICTISTLLVFLATYYSIDFTMKLLEKRKENQ